MGKAFDFVISNMLSTNHANGEPIPVTSADLRHGVPVDSSAYSSYDTELTVYGKPPYIGAKPLAYDRINLPALFDGVSTRLKMVGTIPTTSWDFIEHINARYHLFFEKEDIQLTPTYDIDGLIAIDFTPNVDNVAYLPLPVTFVVDPAAETEQYDLGALLYEINGISLHPSQHPQE